MASTYSPNLRLELIGTGDQQGTWGATTNTNLGTLLEQAIGGYQSVTVSNVADTTLTATNGAADQSRNMVLNLTGTISAARNVICPAIEKLYIVKNATTGGFAVTFKVSGQTGVSIPNGETALLYVDGTDARAVTGTLGFLGAAATGSTNTFTANQIISANSSSDALRITQTGAGNALLVEDSANPDSTPFVVTTDGRVYIGTQSTLGVPLNQPLQISASGTSGATMARFSADTTEPDLRFGKSRSATNGTWGTIVADGDRIGSIRFYADDGASIVQSSAIIASVDGPPGVNDMPGRIAFWTSSDGGVTPIERLRINSSGAIGIAGANFGTSGQVIMSGGSAAAPAWTSLGISNITGLQTALDGKQPLDAELTALAGLSTTADNFIVANGSTWTVETPSQVRTTLGLVIGTNVQAYDATLQSISALGTAADRFAYTTGVDTWAEATITSAGRAILDDASASAQRTTLGLGSLAVLNTVGTAQIDNNSVDGTKIALGSDAQGDIMYYNGTDWARLAAGTSGQVLQTNGSGANPSWVTPAPIGENQTWQTPSRSTGVSYQNTTGRAIQLAISGLTSSGTRSLQVSSDNATWITVGVWSSNAYASAQPIVPNNWYYRMSGSLNDINWAELR